MRDNVVISCRRISFFNLLETKERYEHGNKKFSWHQLEREEEEEDRKSKKDPCDSLSLSKQKLQ